MSLVLVSFVHAANLTCDPQPADVVTKYRLNLDGQIIPAGIKTVGSDQVKIFYNVDHLANGQHKAMAVAGNDNGGWSEWSEEFVFYIGIPTPQNIGLYCETEEAGKISQADWTVYHVSSEEVEHGGFANLAIDGDPDTQWHSTWAATKHPHEIQINLGQKYNIEGFYYLPRQDKVWNGGIKDYVFYTSVDGENWKEVASGCLAKTKNEQFVAFGSCRAKYVRLVVLSEVDGNPWVVVSEINIEGY